MITIQQAIDKLQPFSDVNGVSNVITLLQKLKSPNDDTTDAIIYDLRRQLKSPPFQDAPRSKLKLSFSWLFGITRISLAEIAYDILLRIAAFKPINDTDFLTLEEIPDENKVCTSTGFQFDIKNLVAFANNRHHGTFVNPYTNFKFDPRDDAHLKAVAAEKKFDTPR